MNGNDTFLDINNAHLRVNSGNVQASTFVLDQINIVTSANTASTVNFNNVAKAFNAASSIEVGTANLFVDTTTSNVGIGTDAPAYTLDVHGTANVGNLYTTSNVGINTNSPQQTLHINGGTLIGGHVLPTQHEQFDIGSADAKIRHMFLSDNSLWIGDEAKLSFTGNQLKFRRRKKNAVPRGLVAIGAAQDPELNESTLQTNALAHANKSSVGDMKLEHWLAYAKTLDATKELSDVFTNQDADYDVTSASEAFKEIGNEIYSTHKLRLGSSVAPTATLDITGTAKVSGDVTVDTDTFHIDTTNNKVGIGTTSADTKLHLYATGSGNVLDFKMSGSWSAGDYYRIIGYNTAKQIQFNYNDGMWLSDNNSIRFGCGGTPGTSGLYSERMRITNDGDLRVTGTNTYVQINNGGSIWRNYNSTSGAGLHFTGGAVIPADQNGGNHTSAHTQLGASIYKWGQIYSTSSTISSSDRNEKQDINEITESERKVASKIVDLFRTFRMKDAVSKKGDEARLHNGVIAQDLIEVFQSEGLDAHRYGLFCYDDIWLVDGENELYETVYEKDDSEDGGLKEVKVKTGIFADKDTPGAVATPGPYSIRYEELLCFVVAGELQNERIKYSALEARITALENL